MSTVKAPTFDECYLRVRQQYQEEGIALRIKRRSNEGRRVDILCDRAGKPVSRARQRDVSSKRSDCPFAGKIRYVAVTNEWVWEVLPGHDTHNHEGVAARNFISVSGFRQLSQAQLLVKSTSADAPAVKSTVIDRVEQLSKGGMKSRDIASQLREQEKVMITAQDVRNLQRKLRHEKYGPLTSTQLFCE